MQNARAELAKLLAQECGSVADIQELLKGLFKDTIERVLEAEVENHLGYSKHSALGDGTGNSRNGFNTKTVKTEFGPTVIKVPRDRKGTFQPQIIHKRQVRVNEIEKKVLSLYAKGMSTRDIEAQVKELYGIDVSPALISKITDKIVPEIVEWQSRTLESIYPIVFLDAIHFRVRENSRIVTKAAYTVMGIRLSGHKDILGIWVSNSESASFWASVCNDLRSRGVEDILVVATDGLTGFPDAIRAVFPMADIQRCVIHQLRSCMTYVPWKDRKVVVSDLKEIYHSRTLEQAELRFQEYKQKWGKRFPIVVKSWEKHWGELTTFFNYPTDIRRLIYTTNPVESYHKQLRKVTKTKPSYPSDDALCKIIYLATIDILKKWNKQVNGWPECLAQLHIHFGDRITRHKET